MSIFPKTRPQVGLMGLMGLMVCQSWGSWCAKAGADGADGVPKLGLMICTHAIERDDV